MSSKSTVYVHPIDPSAPSASATSAPVDPVKLWASVPTGGKPAKAGTSRLFYGEKGTTAVASLGDKFGKKTGGARRELVRKAVGSAVKAVKGLGDGEFDVLVDASLDPHASAVAAHLAQYSFTLKTDPPSAFRPGAKDLPANKINLAPLETSKAWETGVTYAKAQNLARTLSELPANMMTPTIFAERVKAEFANVPDTMVQVHDEEWARENGMNTFLSVAKGSSEPPKFVEIHYNGAAPDEQRIAFVGKGVTFDSGGISIKQGAGMKLMRGDMGGGAAVVAATLAIAQLKLPVNLVTVVPLTENMPGPSASKPGDVVYAMNGKSVEIDNTDAEGRLILADALYYASSTYKPHTIIDVATLTGAMVVALGEIFTGTFTTSDELWEELHAAGEAEFDRLWRMPLDSGFAPLITSSNADLCNNGGRPGGSCTAALFLKSFVDGVEQKEGEDEPALRWAHLDIAGTMEATLPTPYLEKGMTGYPVRALIEWAKRQGAQK